jgi:ankyrin repeat protein
MSLHRAARYGDVSRVLSLLKAGQKVDRCDWKGDTPLHNATRKGYTDIAGHLLQHKANPNIVNKKGATPLHVAAYYGYMFMVKILLNYGAHKNIKDNDGDTPAMKAKSKGHMSIYNLLKTTVHREELQSSKEDLLYDAFRNDDVDRVKSLIDEGVNLDRKNEYGWTLYKELISRKSYLMVKLNDTNHLFRMTTDSKSVALLLSLTDPKTGKPYHIALNDDGFNKEIII